MNVNALLVGTLDSLLPTADGVYKGAATEYIVFNYTELPADFADDDAAHYGKHEGASDFDPEKWAGAENLYWKNLLRTMNTQELEEFYKKRLGELPKMEG